MFRDTLYSLLGFIVGALAAAGGFLALVANPTVMELTVVSFIVGMVVSYLALRLAKWMNQQGSQVLEQQTQAQQRRWGAFWYIDATLYFMNAAFVIVIAALSATGSFQIQTNFIVVAVTYSLCLSISVWVGLKWAAYKNVSLKQAPIALASKAFFSFLILLIFAGRQSLTTNAIVTVVAQLIPGTILVYLIARFKIGQNSSEIQSLGNQVPGGTV